jgi:hypothetical protein
MAAILMLASCGGGDNTVDNRREVEKEQRNHAFAPTSAMDQALQTEGTVGAATIHGRLRALMVRGADAASLARDFSGTLDATKLAKLGTSESELNGKFYLASDYSLAFSGDSVTITASKPGTRGYVSEAFSLR